MYFLKYLTIAFLSLVPNVLSNSDIININGYITKKTTDEFFNCVNEIRKKNYHVNYIIHFDTPGGSVLDGLRILDFIESNDVECRATRAYSMGFVLFQACKYRKIEKYGSLMQHDMKLNLHTIDYSNLKSYYIYISDIYNMLIQKQISKLGISKKNFMKKIKNDWWIGAKDALYYNCADEII